jgi:subfamily B ATP-binding cassette protein MsbA
MAQEEQPEPAHRDNDRARDTQRRLLAYLRPHGGIIAAGLLCAAGVAGLTAVLNLALAVFVNAMTRDSVGRLNLICLAAILILLLKALLAYGQNYFIAAVGQRITARMREEVFSHLHSLSLSFFNRRRTGAIVSVLTNDLPVIQNATMTIRDVVAAPLSLVACTVILFYFSWRLTLIAVVVLPLMGLVISRIGKRVRRISDLVQVKLADITTIAEETLAGVRIIKSFATENHEIRRFATENQKTYVAMMRSVKERAQLGPLLELIGALGIVLVLLVAGNEVAYNTRLVQQHLPPISRMDLGGLAGFFVCLQQLARAIEDLGSINVTRQQALAAATRAFTEVLDQRSEVREEPSAITMPKVEGHVVFDRVSFSYNAGPPVLSEISFEVRRGEVMALVGQSGAGKSTLVDLIPRFYDVTAGRILIDGIDVRHVQLESLRRQIGTVPQETWLFAGTLRDNIAYGRRDATDEAIRAAARASNAYFIDAMPDGFATVVGERGVRLSGGERQRIAIARAILTDPRILILDEATSSLDASSEALVQEALDTLMRGRTTIVIAHRLSTILSASRIVVLNHGRIVEMGTHPELLALGGFYAELYERQFGAEPDDEPIGYRTVRGATRTNRRSP